MKLEDEIIENDSDALKASEEIISEISEVASEAEEKKQASADMYIHAGMLDEDIDALLNDADARIQQSFSSEQQYKELTVDEEKKSVENWLHTILFSYCVPILLGILIALIIGQVFLFHAEVPSGSMETTIMTGDRLLGSRCALWFAQPKNGDIMIFWSDEYGEYLVKRCIGCPGDHILIADGNVYVNGKQVSNGFTQGRTMSVGEVCEWDVPENCFFFLGDNRERSADSRYWIEPFIESNQMYAKVLFRYSLGKNGWFIDWLNDEEFYADK